MLGGHKQVDIWGLLVSCLSELMNSMFSERSCLKNRRWKEIEEDTQHQL